MGFSKPITLALGQRSAYLCNNPDCRKLTVGPHSEVSKSLITGEAAHICAESEGAARYDPNQTDAERNGIENGIWLCTECHTKVDRDAGLYPRQRLLGWKAQHETYISGEGWKPDLPEIAISTRTGLTANPSGRTAYTQQEHEMFRDHQLTIKNANSIPIHSFNARLQFPETILALRLTGPIGTQAKLGKESHEWVINSKGKSSIEMNIPEKSPFKIGVMEIDKINPGRTISALLRSVVGRLDLTLPETTEPGLIEHYFEGSFQYEWKGIFYNRNFVLPMSYDRTTRKITTNAIYDNAEDHGLQLMKNIIFF